MAHPHKYYYYYFIIIITKELIKVPVEYQPVWLG